MSRLGQAVVLCIAAVLVAPASAGDSDYFMYLEVCREGVCVGTYVVPTNDAVWTGSAWVWQLSQETPITNPTLGQVALLKPGTFVEVTPAGGPRSNPAVNLGFAMQAGNAPTTFTVKSALLSFATIPNASGRASAAFTVTDGFNDDGGTLSGLGTGAGGGAYLAQVNGFVPGGANFAELVNQIQIPVMGGNNVSAAFPADYSFFPIGAVSDMSTQISFDITANDLASGTSIFEIVPEPSALLLALAGLGVIRRR